MNLKTTQGGTTLVEVLIAAIIVAIGLLGIATLQIKALQASTDAEHRANATDIAAALADRIRANLGGPSFKENHKNYIKSLSTSADCPAASVCSSSPDETVSASQCTPAAMADYDLDNLYCGAGGVLDKLPGGEMNITCDGNCDGTTNMHIQISWTARNDVFGDNKDSITLSFIPGRDPEN